MNELLENYRSYIDAKNFTLKKIELIQENIINVGFDPLYISSLLFVDNYAKSIGATRKGSVYTLSHGQRIRYCKFSNTIKDNFYRMEIKSESAIFYKSMDEIKKLNVIYTNNEKLRIDLKKLNKNIDVIENNIKEILNCFRINVKNHLILDLFETHQKYLDLKLEHSHTFFSFDNFKDVISKEITDLELKYNYALFTDSKQKKHKLYTEDFAYYLFNKSKNKNLIEIIFISFEDFISENITKQLF